MATKNLVFLSFVGILLAFLIGLFYVRSVEKALESSPVGSGKMFDAIASRYDVTNTILSLGMHRSWREEMIKELELKTGDVVLDAGTGTADVAIMIAQQLRKLSQDQVLVSDSVVGVDPSENMLAIGRTKIEKAGFSDSVVRLVLGDAQDLGASLSPDAMFDAITMAFAIRNVPDRDRAIQQLASRLRPGGRLAILELQSPSFAPARWFVRYVVPALGALASGGAWREYRHLEASVLAFDPAALAAILRAAGLRLRPTRTMNFGSVGLFVADRP